MDESYLDSLLNEISLDKEIDHKIEEELDDQIKGEKQKRRKSEALSREDAFNLDLEMDVGSLEDEGDLDFSETQIEELDHLDQIADLDMGDLDFSDIDFDDLDMTRLDDLGDDNLDDLLMDFEKDLKIDQLYDMDLEEPDQIQEAGEREPVASEAKGKESVRSEAEAQPAQKDNRQERFVPVQQETTEEDNLDASDFDADSFLDGLLDEADRAEAGNQPVVELSEKDDQDPMETADIRENVVDPLEVEAGSGGLQDLDGFADFGQVQESVPDAARTDELSGGGSDDLDDLFAMLDMDGSGDETAGVMPTGDADGVDQQGEAALEEMVPMQSLDEPAGKKKKKSFMEILFGEPDEDDIVSEEELAAAEAKKAAKKAKKDAAKAEKAEKAEAAKQQKEAVKGAKKEAAEQKKRIRAEKKAKRKAEEQANAEPEKELNKPAVAFIFSLFLGGTALFYLASNNFNYVQAIEKATKYFANQRYRNAYDEIVGVEVKQKDEELKDRIYTVMYVERLFEAYQNNLELKREEKALDSLLRGVDKYYEHYEEAEELGITSDLDYSFEQVKLALQERYGISVEEALEINRLENMEYVETVNRYIAEPKTDIE